MALIEITDNDIKHQLEMCVLSKKNKCDKANCVSHRLYDPSLNGNFQQSCEDYLSFEEALWCGWCTGEEIIGSRRINLPIAKY